MKKEKMQLLLKKFNSKEEMKRFLEESYDNGDRTTINELYKNVDRANAMSIPELIVATTKARRYPTIKYIDIYRDVLDEIDSQRIFATLMGKTKEADELNIKRYDLIDTAKDGDVDRFLKKSFPSGYNLLAKTLKNLEKNDEVCYNECKKSLSNGEAISDVVRALQNLSEVDSDVNGFVDTEIRYNDNYHLPTIEGMPLGAYAAMPTFKGFWGNGKRFLNELKDKFANNQPKQTNNISSANVLQNSNDVNNKSALEVKDWQNQKPLAKNLDAIETSKEKSIFEKTVDWNKERVGKRYDDKKQSDELTAKLYRHAGASALDTVSGWTKKDSGFNVFTKNLAEDLRNFDPNNSDIEKIKTANFFSAYKGKKVIKNDLKDSVGISGTFGMGDNIFIDKDNQKNDNEPYTNIIMLNDNELEETLNHEYGHTLQYDNLGLIGYLAKVAIPSVDGFYKDLERQKDMDTYDKTFYYKQPWENSADILGGVIRDGIDSEERKKIDKVGERVNWFSKYARDRAKEREIDSWN